MYSFCSIWTRFLVIRFFSQLLIASKFNRRLPNLLFYLDRSLQLPLASIPVDKFGFLVYPQFDYGSSLWSTDFILKLKKFQIEFSGVFNIDFILGWANKMKISHRKSFPTHILKPLYWIKQSNKKYDCWKKNLYVKHSGIFLK